MSVGNGDVLRVKGLVAENFRGFERRRLDFAHQFNVLVGDNGAGKTAVLDALAVCLAPVLDGMVPINGEQRPELTPADVRLVARPSKGMANVEPQYPARVACSASLLGQEREWGVVLHGPGEQPGPYGTIEEVSSRLWVDVRDGADLTLPVIAYYGPERTQRSWSGEELSPAQPASRTAGYSECLRPGVSEARFLQWFMTLSLAEVSESSPIPHLTTARRAMVRCLQGCDEVGWNFRQHSMLLSFADGRTLPFGALSHGYRATLTLVADIACRASLLNPTLDDPAAQTPGVVLIDELDLHLHPNWQRTVVGDLRRTFPAVQFICTTHSPFIIQALRPGELIDLEGEAAAEYADKPIEDIAEYVMGVPTPQRSLRYVEMAEAAERYYELLHRVPEAPRDERERLKAELDRLVEPFSDDVAYYTFLRMEREAAGLGDANQ